MSIYKYPQSKVIDQVTFQKNERGGVRAYLHAHLDADAPGMCEIVDGLRSRGYQCIPYTLNNQPVLEVRGVRKESKFLDSLSSEGWINGQAQITPEQEKISFKDKVIKRSLQLSGAAYVSGDAGLLKYAIVERDPLLKAGSISYALGTWTLLGYGRNDQSNIQVHDLSKNLEDFAKSRHMDIPSGSVVHHVATDTERTMLQKTDEFLRRYPSEVFNSVTALAGVFIGVSAFKNRVRVNPEMVADLKALKEIRHEGWLDVGLGVLTGSSGMLATFVKEKSHDPDSPPKHGVAWVKEKVQEHPLSIAGIGYLIATGFHGISTHKKYKEAKRLNDAKSLEAVKGRAWFVLMATIAEVLITISSKGHGEGVLSDNSIDNSVISVAAELISRQPAERQEELIQEMGTFLGEQKILAMKNDKVVTALREEVTAMRTNPWACRNERMPMAQEPVLLQTAPAKEAMPNWQSKVRTEVPDKNGPVAANTYQEPKWADRAANTIQAEVPLQSSL